MSESVPVHVSVGEPEAVNVCPACQLPSLITVPLAGMWEGGVVAMAALTFCDRCGLPKQVVSDYIEQNGYDSPPQ